MKDYSESVTLVLLLLTVILPSADMMISLYAQRDDGVVAAAQTTHTSTCCPGNTSSLSTQSSTSTATTKPGRRGGVPPGLTKAWAHSNMSVVARAVTMAIFLNDTHGTALSRIAIDASSNNQLIKNVAYNQTVVHVKFDRDGSVVLIINASAKPSVVYGDDLKLSEKLSTLGLTPDSEAWVYDNNKRIIIIFADPSSITISYLASQQALTTTTTSQPTTGPRCIIATVAYGSELAPEVQSLRNFRDNIVLPTEVGRCFMTAFNRWYYSFSPSVAKSLSESGGARAVVKASLYPLVTVLQIASGIYSTLPFTAELSMVLTGITTAVLLSLIYLFPVGLLISFTFRKKNKKA